MHCPNARQIVTFSSFSQVENDPLPLHPSHRVSEPLTSVRNALVTNIYVL